MAQSDVESWFLTDVPEQLAANDAFNHVDVASNLRNMVLGHGSGRLLIGLVGPFGVGKSTVIEMLQEALLDEPSLRLVRISVERHGQTDFKRTVIYALAEALIGSGLLTVDNMESALADLEYTSTDGGVNPLKSPVFVLTTFISNLLRRSVRYLLYWLGISVLTSIVVLGMLTKFGVDLSQSWTQIVAVLAGIVLTVSPTIILVFRALRPDKILQAWFAPGTWSRSKPRAETSDAYERAFARLVVDAKTSLVIAIDDIDRLASNEVLMALDQIRSYQLSCAGRMPIFIVSADEDIVADAISKGRDGDSDSFAKAYLDRLFVQRQGVPPHPTADLREFASGLISRHQHPSITVLGTNLPRVIDVLIHDQVRDPRHVLRLLNGFFSDYRLATLRESGSGRRSINPGVVTGHPAVLARLSVLKTDFRVFHQALVEDTDLLAGVEKAVVDPTDISARLARFADRPDWAELKAYVGRTATWAEPVDDLLPFLYLGQSNISRLLGSRDAHEVRDCLVNRKISDFGALVRATSLEGEQRVGVVLDYTSEVLRTVDGPELANALEAASSVADLLGKPLLARLSDQIAAGLGRTKQAKIDPDAIVSMIVGASDDRIVDVLSDHLFRGGDLDFTLERGARVFSSYDALASRVAAPKLDQYLEAALQVVENVGTYDALRPWLVVLERGTSPARTVQVRIIQAIFTALEGRSDPDETWAEAVAGVLRNAPAGDVENIAGLVSSVLGQGLEGTKAEIALAAWARMKLGSPSWARVFGTVVELLATRAPGAGHLSHEPLFMDVVQRALSIDSALSADLKILVAKMFALTSTISAEADVIVQVDTLRRILGLEVEGDAAVDAVLFQWRSVASAWGENARSTKALENSIVSAAGLMNSVQLELLYQQLEAGLSGGADADFSRSAAVVARRLLPKNDRLANILVSAITRSLPSTNPTQVDGDLGIVERALAVARPDVATATALLAVLIRLSAGGGAVAVRAQLTICSLRWPNELVQDALRAVSPFIGQIGVQATLSLLKYAAEQSLAIPAEELLTFWNWGVELLPEDSAGGRDILDQLSKMADDPCPPAVFTSVWSGSEGFVDHLNSLTDTALQAGYRTWLASLLISTGSAPVGAVRLLRSFRSPLYVSTILEAMDDQLSGALVGADTSWRQLFEVLGASERLAVEQKLLEALPAYTTSDPMISGMVQAKGASEGFMSDLTLQLRRSFGARPDLALAARVGSSLAQSSRGMAVLRAATRGSGPRSDPSARAAWEAARAFLT